MALRILTTGGTIEGYVDPTDQNLKPLLPKMLDNARLSVPYNVESVFAKDSRAITDEDRNHLLNAIYSCSEHHIIVSHGTITMCETARFLAQKVTNKVVVLVGAMIPADQENSDSEFNIGAATMATLLSPEGVYVCMNGILFDANNVHKNEETGYFETIK